MLFVNLVILAWFKFVIVVIIELKSIFFIVKRGLYGSSNEVEMDFVHFSYAL